MIYVSAGNPRCLRMTASAMPILGGADPSTLPSIALLATISCACNPVTRSAGTLLHAEKY